MTAEVNTDICIDVRRTEYTDRISETFRGGVESILATGRLLLEAKDKLKHGQFLSMIEADLPFGKRAAQMIMAICLDHRLTNAQSVALLPPAWGTLYQLSQLHDDEFERGLADGVIRPDMTRGEVKRLQATPGHLAKPESATGDVDDPAAAVHQLRRLTESIEKPRVEIINVIHGMRHQLQVVLPFADTQEGRKLLGRINRIIELLNIAEMGALQLEAGKFCQQAWDKIN